VTISDRLRVVVLRSGIQKAGIAPI